MNDIEENIIRGLEEEALSTSELADLIGEERNVVYRKCRRMEEKGILDSHIEKSDKLLFYCPLVETVLTGFNYKEIIWLLKRLRQIGKLKSGDYYKILKYVNELKRKGYVRIKELSKKIMGKSYDEIIRLIKLFNARYTILVPFHPNVRVWEVLEEE